MRDGILAERQSFYLDNQAEREPAEVAEEFIGQYYSASPAMPKTIVVGPYLRERAELLAEALSERRGAPVEVRVAERGDKRRLRELAERNARLALDQDRLRREHRRQRRVESLAALREALGMEELPVRIEGFDISNIGGEHTVASMVVFEGGATKKADYRRFKVARARASNGSDDFASMEEVLGRRVNRYLEQVDLSPHDGKRDESFASLPSLLVIDGGKGQLAAGMRALRPSSSAASPSSPSPSGWRRSTSPAVRSRSTCRRLGGLEAAAAGPRRGAPLRDRPPPRPPRPGDDRLGARRAEGESARPASAPCSSTSAPRSASWRRPARSWRRCPACLANWRARSTSS